MFGKKLNIIFWLLVIPAIFFVFASTTFISPSITENGDVYTVVQFQVYGLTLNSSSWTTSVNWIVLIIFGLLFSLIGIYQFFKFLLLSNRFTHFSKRSKFPGVKKVLAKGQAFYNYDLFFYPFFKSFAISPLSKNKDLTKFDTNTIFVAYLTTCLVLTLTIVLSLVFPLVFADKRVVPSDADLQVAGNDLTAVNKLVAALDNDWIMYSCMSGALICFIVAFLILVVAVTREIIKGKIGKISNINIAVVGSQNV